MVGFWTLVVAILGVLVSAAIYGVKYYYAPKFVIGVLPSKGVMKSGTIVPEDIRTKSALYEAIFKESYLAKEVFEEADLQDIKKAGAHWQESLAADGFTLDLAIIVQNVGRRVAEGYFLGISFPEPGIELSNVETESLKVEMFYTQKAAAIEAKEVKKPAQFILDTYQAIDLPCAWVSLVGHLGSKAFEMVHLALKVPSRLRSFLVVFRIDCSKAWDKTSFYAQCVELNKERGTAQGC